MTQTIPVNFGVCVRSLHKSLEDAISNWSDGGENKKIAGWSAISWAESIEHGGNVVYAIGIVKDGPDLQTDEDGYGYIPEDYTPDPDDVVYMLNESVSGYEHVFFSCSEHTLQAFCHEIGINFVIMPRISIKQTL